MIQCLRELVDWCMFAWFYHHTLNTVVSLDQQSLSLTTSSCLLFEVGNDNRDTTFDDGVSLPASYISIHFGQILLVSPLQVSSNGFWSQSEMPSKRLQ